MGYLYQTATVGREDVPLKPGDGAVIKVVAIVGDTGKDWAAYWGWANLEDHQIAAYGRKLPKEAAEGLFPYFVDRGLSYRL